MARHFPEEEEEEEEEAAACRVLEGEISGTSRGHPSIERTLITFSDTAVVRTAARLHLHANYHSHAASPVPSLPHTHTHPDATGWVFIRFKTTSLSWRAIEVYTYILCCRFPLYCVKFCGEEYNLPEIKS